MRKLCNLEEFLQSCQYDLLYYYEIYYNERNLIKKQMNLSFNLYY